MSRRFQTIYTAGLGTIFTIFVLAILILMTESVSVSAQGGTEVTPTLDPMLYATRDSSEHQLPSYQAEPELITDNVTVEGHLSADQTRYVYIYHAAERTRLRVDLSAKRSNIELKLIDPNADPSQIIDYVNPNRVLKNVPTSLETHYTFMQTQTVWLVVYNNSGRNLNYTLTTKLITAELIQYGDTVTGNLGLVAGELISRVHYDFDAEAGDVIEVTVDAELDTQLILEKFDSTFFTWNDGGGAGDNPELHRQIIQEPGLYRLTLSISHRVSNNNLQAPYGYKLTLAESAYLAFEPNTRISLEYENERAGETLVFEGKAGQAYELIVLDSISNQPIFITVWQENERLTETLFIQQSEGEERVEHILEFTPNHAGQVRIVVYHQISSIFAGGSFIALTLTEK